MAKVKPGEEYFARPKSGKSLKKKANTPTAKQRKRWGKIAALGCIVAHKDPARKAECKGRITIHHCGTGLGCRKDHDKVIAPCYAHHLGRKTGIDGKGQSKRDWQATYGSEGQYLLLTSKLLGEI